MEVDDNFAYLGISVLENLTRDEERYIEVSKQIANDIQVGKLTTLEVIQKLGCLLLDQSFSKRDIGVLLLSEALHDIKNGCLSSEQLSVLASYISEKLKDHHQVATSALKGVLAIVRFLNTPSESIVLLISTIFNHITCQQQQQQDRYLIFEIFETVLKQHTKVVESMGIDFVYGVITSIDGERDPKNLIYLFDWLQFFLKTVKLGHLTEETFDILACYFPVDFKAPPSDKNKISREDLAQGLCKCLICISDFGQYGIPLALEKLDSALRIAKEDSLDVLISGCGTYDVEIYYQHSIELWSQLQKEVFSTSDEDLRRKCLETLKVIISKLSRGNQKNFENTVLDIADTLKGNLLPDSKLFSHSSQILIYVARACEASSVLVVKKVLPILENTFKITTNPKQKAVLLSIFSDFVKADLSVSSKFDLTNREEIASFPSLCYQAIVHTEPDLVIEGYRGFTEITQFIPENICQVYFQTLCEAVTAPLEKSVKYAALESLEKVAEIYPQEVERHLLQNNLICDIASLDNYLDGLSHIVYLPYFEDLVINLFISYCVDSISNSKIALKHLNNILCKFDHIARILVQKNFITKLVDFLVRIEETDTLGEIFLTNINSVLQNVVRNQEAIVQGNIYSIHSNRNFRNQNLLITVISGLIIPMHRGVFEEYNKIDYLVNYSFNAYEESVRNISLEVLGNVLNKIDSESILDDRLNKIKLSCESCSEDSKIWLISWITKGLVTRNHPKACEWTDMLLNCLQNNTGAAKGFRIIMDESYKAISKENHCQIMPLYKQTFFIYCTNKLMELSQNDNCAYLHAAGYLIEKAPKAAIVGHFKKIIRLILLCLERSNEATVMEVLLQRITQFIISRESIIEDSLEDILLRVLDLTNYDASMTVRIAALKCLLQMTVTYKVYQLLPYKQKVIKQLGICVDDRKRLVRRDAMECRSLWYLLDSPV